MEIFSLPTPVRGPNRSLPLRFKWAERILAFGHCVTETPNDLG
jgi:hypothetical protein